MKSLRTLLFVALFSIGLIYGFAKKGGPQAGPPVRILALGDSHTFGEGISAPERWPEQLAVLLRNAGWRVDEPRVLARSGWTTADLLAGLEALPDLKDQPPYDLVGLLIGVNNLFQGRSEAEYRAQFDKLLAQAIGFAGGRPERVFVLSIPDWGASSIATASERPIAAARTDAFNRIKAELSRARGASYVEITGLSRQVSAHPEWLAPDGLHYAAPMHLQWAQRVMTVYRRVIPYPDPNPSPSPVN